MKLIILIILSGTLLVEPKKQNKVEQAIKHPELVFTNRIPNNYASPGRAKHDKGPPPGQEKKH